MWKKDHKKVRGWVAIWKAQSVGKSYDTVSFMSKTLAVKKAQGILF